VAKKTLFEYRDYKKYLSDIIDQMPNHGRGERSKIAAVLRCHIAYISQVLNGDAHLSLEQADVLNQHLGHTSDESDFFLLLVLIARAGTKSLREHYIRKLDQILAQRTVLKNRLQYQKELSPQVQATYYSAWYYAAIHMMLDISELRTKEGISDYLSLPIGIVSEVLEFLVASGLATQKGATYENGLAKLHLGSDSPMISKHHTNWRLQALQSLERKDSRALHYSSVITVEEKLVPQIREALVQAIEHVRSVMKPSSKDEVIYCYALDFFEIGGKKQIPMEKTKGEKRKKYVEESDTHPSH
jgi:uncharacterized protein (TIGR02147 family)